eukprot:gene10188-21234_t
MSRTGLEDGLEGQAVGLGLAVKEVMKDNSKVVKIEEDLKRDFYLTAAEAVAYGVVDAVLKPPQPVKMARFRGIDDDNVQYGHFCESKPLMTGPTDKLVQLRADNEEEFDESMVEQMKEQGYDPANPLQSNKDRKAAKNVNRFANSRCRPPGLKKKAPSKNLG